MRMVNTYQAHQLLHWAGQQGKQTELKLELFDDFFTHRKDVSDRNVLVAAAGRVGLPTDEAMAVLESGRFAGVVRGEEQQWLDREVHAVPTFFFNGRYQVPGAQEAETFVRILEKIAASEAA